MLASATSMQVCLPATALLCMSVSTFLLWGYYSSCDIHRVQLLSLLRQRTYSGVVARPHRRHQRGLYFCLLTPLASAVVYDRCDTLSLCLVLSLLPRFC